MPSLCGNEQEKRARGTVRQGNFGQESILKTDEMAGCGQ